MKCQVCGFENDNDALFCASCGNRLTNTSTPTIQTPKQSQPTQHSEYRTDDLIKEEDFDFATSIFPWVRGSAKINEHGFSLQTPATIFGLIPYRATQVFAPMGNISNVGTNFSIKWFRAFVGVVFMIIGAALNSYIAAMIFFLIIGALLIFSSIKITFMYERSGLGSNIVVPFYENQKMKVMAAALMTAVGKYGYKEVRATNRNVHAVNQSTQHLDEGFERLENAIRN